MICEWKLGNRRATDLWMGHVYQAEIDNPQTHRLLRSQLFDGFGVRREAMIEAYTACDRPDTMLFAFALDMMPRGAARKFADPALRKEMIRLALTQVTNANAVAGMRGISSYLLTAATYVGGDWEKTIEYGRLFSRENITFVPDVTADVMDLFYVNDSGLVEVERNVRTGRLDIARVELERLGKCPKLGFHEARYVTNTLKRIAVMQGRDPSVYEPDDAKLLDTPLPLTENWQELAIRPESELWFGGRWSFKPVAAGGFALDTKPNPNSRTSARSTYCRRKIAPDYECELELAFPDVKKGGLLALRVPVPRSTSGGFAQVGVTNGVFKAGCYYVGTHSRKIWNFLNARYGEPVDEVPKDGKVTMRVRVKDKRLSLWINAQQVTFDWYVPHLEDPNFKEYTNVCLLGERVVIRRLRLRRVPVEVP